MFDAAVEAALPDKLLGAYLPKPPKGRTVVVGCGKAAASMAKAVEDHWAGALSGLVVTRYGHRAATRRIEVVEAAHPVPDLAGSAAAARILTMVQGLSADDLILFLASGGGSALLALPAPGLTLADKKAVTRTLLTSGANIAEINCVRKHLSAVKGGRIAAAGAPARIVTLAISDVPGDDPALIASGPTVADPTTFADALAVLHKYRITQPAAVLNHLHAAVDETPKPDDPRFARHELHVVATAKMSLEAAAEVARKAGVTPLILGDAIEGESRDVALVHAGIARQVKREGHPATPPCVLLSGGETTVTVRGHGRGGRNTEFLLAVAMALNGEPGISALAADTDGIDGTETSAGAVLTSDSLERAAARNLDVTSMLADNDSHRFFSELGDLVITGPTLTNVNDFRAILVE